MTPSISAVGFSLEPKQSEMVESKLKRIAYADDLIVDLLIKIKQDKAYIFDTTVNFTSITFTHLLFGNCTPDTDSGIYRRNP